jgi:hypothetical protein
LRDLYSTDRHVASRVSMFLYGFDVVYSVVVAPNPVKIVV